MPQPTIYTRQYSATGWTSSSPALPHPGVSLDAEFNAIKVTLDGVLRSFLLIQRDDGALKNRIVTIDSLSPAVLAALGAGSNWVVRGAWATATAYAVSDVMANGTATYVCAIAHNSGTLATDIAAGRWVLIYDDAANALDPGSVTTTALADGAVTAEKLGFTSLDLTGSIRAQGGLAAGTAAAGSLMRAKRAAGDVFVEAERTTAAQGRAGFKMIGVNADWTIAMATNSTLLEIAASAGGGFVSIDAAGATDASGTVRATGAAVRTNGAGAEIQLSAGVALFQGYDRTAAAWLPTKIRGLTVWLSAGGVDIAEVTTTGLKVRDGLEVGFRRVPRSTTATTAVVADAGRCIATAAAITIPAAVFSAGDALSIYNDSASAITITQGAGLTMRQAGTSGTGTRNLAARGLATIWFNSASEAIVTGAGVS